MMKITIITVSTTAIRELVRAHEKIAGEFPGIMDLKLFNAARQMSANKRTEMCRDIVDSDFVLIDLMGSPTDIVKDVSNSLESCRGHIVPYGAAGRAYLRLGAFTAGSMSMGRRRPDKEDLSIDPGAMQKMADMAEKMGKMIPLGKMRDMRNFVQLTKYFRVADVNQLENMLSLILRDYGGYKNLPVPEPAREIADAGICDPATKTYYRDYQDYVNKYGFDRDKPTVGVLYYGHTYPDDTSGCVTGVIERIREYANVLPIACSGAFAENLDQIGKWLKHAAGKPVDLIVNFMSFRLGAGPMGGDAERAIDILKEVNAPYLHPFFMSRRRVSEWKESSQGITSSEFMISVMLPEFDGCIETIPVGAMGEPIHNEEFDIELKALSLIEERVDRLASRIKNQLKLRTKSNSEKRVALICYNYPPGEDNLFGGSFLDTFASIGNILVNLKKEGYQIDALNADELLEHFTTGNIINSANYSDNHESMIKYPSGAYREELETRYYQNEIIQQWGTPPGTIMTGEKGEFLIPGIVSGNIFIGLQPSRGVHEDDDKVYHDKALLPHHQYIAFYKWLRDEFKADAIVHVGTHGTIEFLKGKECGMSGDCFPDILIADIPHVYLYYVGNPSEAMIAKRRSYADLIGYQPPQYLQGELYGEYTNLSTMIDEYHEAQRLSPARSDDIYKAIRKIAEENNLPTGLEEMERELYRMKRSLIPKGLHVFGNGYTGQEARSYLKGLLRYDRGEIKSLRRIAAEINGSDYDTLLNANTTKALESADVLADKIIDTYFETGSLRSLSLDGEHKQECINTLEYGKSITNRCCQNNETAGLLRTLNGEYNPARLAGDIFRNPEVMPTGYNLYQFDSRFVPSDIAYKRGEEIARNTLEQYRKENGELPSSIAVILWGLETSRTHGETVSQVLAYLGVRVVRSSNIWEPKYEIIPLDELGRKRVDVVVNICGFFRDMFPNIIDEMNKVFEQLAQLDEPDEMNCFKANTKKIYKSLIDRGYDEDEARELSYSRIFGPAEAEYGTRITGIIETRNWQNEEQIGEEYINRLKHIYSKNYRGRDVDGLFNSNLKSVDIVSQIRSNHEYEITDLDHYYEFFGGLAKSVEMAKGIKASMYITDTTGERIETEGVEKSIGRGIRTRVLNPKWIDGMLEHKYHGVQKIAERFENVMGLAATTNSVEEWIFNDLHTAYIEDEEMRQRLKENNAHAYMSIVEQMMEYYQRGYWNASEEQINKLKEIFLELEGDIEEKQ
jgi:cobaltochelatase CobN